MSLAPKVCRPARPSRGRITPLAGSIAALLLWSASSPAQTYTSPAATGNFTNPLVWNLGAGPLPASNAALELNFLTYGTGAVTAANDLNLTLKTLNLSTFGTAALTLSASLGGGYAFTGGAGTINLLGSGAATSLSAGVVLGQGLTSLTFDGAGASGVNISGVVASNTAAGAPLVIATDAGNSVTGITVLGGANTFAGGVVLNTGALALNNARALGDRGNTLTVNGGTLRSGVVLAVANNVTLNSTLNVSTLNGSLTLAGTLSGAGGVTMRPGAVASNSTLVLTGMDTYTGATTVGAGNVAAAPVDGAGGLSISGAVGSILGTSGITIRDGAVLNLRHDGGASVTNSRVAAGTAIGVQGGFLQVVGHTGIARQSVGTVNAGGLTTLAALTNGAGTGTAGAATELTVGNLVRSAGTTVLFEGQKLGSAAVAPGLAAAQANVILSKINGAAPTGALVGGSGAAGPTTTSILPWALGDGANSGNLYAGGTGFVTYETNGVRLLDAATEYNITNKFNLVGATENLRVTGTITSHTAPTTVNAVYFANTGQTLAGGANALTITSGALASNVVAAEISNPVLFGPAGAGEAVVSVVDALAGTANSLKLSGGFTAASLTKSGHGDLTIATVDPTLTGPITINGGEIRVDQVSRLGTPSGITVNGQSQSASRAGLAFTHTSGTQTLATPIVLNGGAAGITTTAGGGTLALNSTISGTGGVNYTAATSSTIQIGGTNTYTGPTFLSGTGTVAINNDGAFGSSADPASGFLSINNANLKVNGAWTSARHLSFSFAVGINTGANPVTLSGPIVGSSVVVTKTGSGTLSITGNDSSFSGTITLGSPSAVGGTLAISGTGALNSASVTFGNNLAPAGTYVLDLSGATDIDPTDGSSTPWRSVVALNTSGGTFTPTHTVQLGSTFGAPVDLRVDSGSFGGTAGVISGFGKLVKMGTGTLVLNSQAASTFTGGVEVRGGTLTFSSDNPFGNAANGFVVNGGILNYTGAGLASNRAITLGATPQPILSGSAVVQTLVNGLSANGPIDFNGAISGAGGFNKSGSNTFALVGVAANTYLGDTQISVGTLGFSNSNQLGASGSRIRLNGGTLRDIASSGTQTLNRTIFVTANSTVDAGSTARLELSGPIVGTNTITKTSVGGLAVSENNSSFFGTLTVGNGTAAGGNLTLTSTGQLRGATVNLSAAAASTFDLSGLTRDLGTLGAGTGFATGNTVALGTGGALTTGFNNAAMNWAGSITGDANAAVTKVGTNVLTITSNTHTFGGGFHLLSGNAAFSTTGTLPGQSVFTLGGWGTTANAGSRFAIDNSGTNVASRLGDAQIIHSNSGEISYAGFSTLSTETVGSLRGAGQTTITMITGGTLNFADATNGLTRLDRGTFLFRSQSGLHGTTAASTTVPNLTFGNLPGSELIGGGGAGGTKTISILPYAISGAATADGGRDFVTYGANGVRALTANTEVQANLLTAGATENVRMADAIQTTSSLAADQVINSLNISSNPSSTRIESVAAQKLTVTSGAVLSNSATVWTGNAAGTAGVALGIQTAELLTGAGNTRELNVFTAGGSGTADLALGAKVSTTGGLTKSGAAALYLTNPANAYTGQTTINAGSLVIDDKAALGGSTSLVIGGGFLKYRGGDTTLTGFTVKAAGGAAAGLGASAGFHVVSGTTLTLPASSVSGNGGILKDGTGVLKLTGTNTNSGATIISGGALAIDGPAALGTNSRVIFGTSLSTSGGQTLRFDAPMTLTQDFITNSTNNGIGFGFDTNGNNVTLSGTILDARNTSIRGLYKFGAGELNLTATEMYTGPTQLFGGTLRLSGANGSVLNSTGTTGFYPGFSLFLNPGSALVLDNSAANNNNRLPDVWDTPFGTGNAGSGMLRMVGGEFRLIGNASGTSERINQLNVATGTITLAGGGTTLTSGLLNRTEATSGGLIRGTNLGATPGATSTNWFVTDLGSGGVQLGGAGGAKGTPFVNILPGFIGDSSATGIGTDLVTYGADVGFRLLTAGEYTATIPSGNFDLNRAPNVALTGEAAVNQTTAITALKLGAGANLGGTGTLLLGQSTVLATGNATIDVPSLTTRATGANDAYIFQTPGAATTLTVNSILPGGSSSALMKRGDGTLILNGRLLGGLTVSVSEGTLRLGAANASLNPLGASVAVAPGATFDLGGSDRTISFLRSFALSTTPTTFSQSVDGTVALGGNRLTLYSLGGDFTGSITGGGGLTKAFNSTLTSAFTQPLAYTGSTVIRGGTFQLAGAGTLASAAVEIRGGTLQFNNADDNAAAGGYIANRLGTTVPITLAGGITFTENANTPANHNLGPVTLAGAGTLTITNGATAPSTVTIANLTRSAARGTLTVSATNLGLAPSPIGNARIFTTQIEGAAPAGALIGGGGAVGSTTQSILPWAFSSTGSSFLTYGADGLRPLAQGEYEPNALDSPSSATVNSIISTSFGLTAPRTVNSLFVTGGTVNGPFDLTLTSGALAIPATVTLGVNTNALLTGNGNTRELVIYNSTAPTTLNYNLTTSGGVTKYGTGTLQLRGTNTFTGGLTINEATVSFNNDNQLGAPGGVVRFGDRAGNFSADLTYAGPALTPLAFSRPIETTSFGGLTGVPNNRWQLNGAISGAGGIAYDTIDAVFEINAANTYTGVTRWINSHLYINGDSAFGNGGELIMGTTPNQNIVLRGPWITSRLIHASNGSALQTNGFDATWSGQFIGTGAFTKNGTGALILTEAMPFFGGITVNAGEVRLRDRGSLAASASARTVNPGAALTLDDTGVHFPDRLADLDSQINLSGGELKLLGNSAVTTEEVIGNLSLIGQGVATVTVAPGSGQAAILRFAGGTGTALSVGGTTASLWRGPNLGVNAPGTANSANVIMVETAVLQQTGLAGATFLTGGAAPAGSPSVSVIRGGFGDLNATGLGTHLVTYDFDKGVRLLNPTTEYTATLINGTIVTDNVKADASTLALANSTTANTLWLSNAASVTGAGTLTLTAGSLLVTGTGNTIANPLAAPTTLTVGGPGDVALNGPIGGAGGLTKLGAGTLTLGAANSFTGAVALTAGTLAIGNASALPATTALQLNGGAIQNVTGSPLALANNLTLNGPMFVSGAQDLTFSGNVSLANATREINVTNTGTTTLSGVISSSQTLINYGLTKTGPGLLVLNNTNPYDGETTINGGELRISGSIAASTLTIINAGTLSGKGIIGALRTTGGFLAPGAAGAGTLNVGDITFAGGTFALELATATSADKLNVTGGVSLTANTALTLSLLGGYVPTPGESWTLIDNDGTDAITTGSFRFTSAGDAIDPLTPFTLGATQYVLNYAGGTGNDLVLQAIPEPSTSALLAGALGLLGFARRRRSCR
ncbi:MAG: autotransporter-associated beta strand repeat-containing protein [Chthoniobacteraceae bacterium]